MVMAEDFVVRQEEVELLQIADGDKKVGRGVRMEGVVGSNAWQIEEVQ